MNTIIELKDDISNHLNEKFNDIERILFYGSILYPCLFNNKISSSLFNSNSDVDIIILANIIKNDELCLEYKLSEKLQQYFQIETISLNIRFITTTDFYNYIKKCNDFVFIQALLENTNAIENMNKVEFRQLVSKTSSNSFVKCFKKIQDNEIYIGLKSLFHSIMIPVKAIEYLSNKKNYNYEKLFNEILYDYQYMTINQFKLKYQKQRNTIMSEFRLLCPKIEKP